MPQPTLPQLTPDELMLEGLKLSKEIIAKVFQHHTPPLRTVVVLEALMLLYRLHAEHLPPDAQGLCAMALGQMAGDLLQRSAAPAMPQHTTH